MKKIKNDFINNFLAENGCYPAYEDGSIVTIAAAINLLLSWSHIT